MSNPNNSEPVNFVQFIKMLHEQLKQIPESQRNKATIRYEIIDDNVIIKIDF